VAISKAEGFTNFSSNRVRRRLRGVYFKIVYPSFMDTLKLTLGKTNLSVTSGQFSMLKHVQGREKPDQTKIELPEQLPIFDVFAVEEDVIDYHMVSAFGHCRNCMTHPF